LRHRLHAEEGPIRLMSGMRFLFGFSRASIIAGVW
jgi:hypothetical protein